MKASQRSQRQSWVKKDEQEISKNKGTIYEKKRDVKVCNI